MLAVDAYNYAHNLDKGSAATFQIWALWVLFSESWYKASLDARLATGYGRILDFEYLAPRSAKQTMTPSSLIPRSAGAGERVAYEAIDQLGIADADSLHDLGVHADVGEARQRVDFVDEELAVVA